jgi:hypothetical protein
LNAVSKTFGWWSLRRSSYDQGFHDYVLEWDEQFMYVYFFFFSSLPVRTHYIPFFFIRRIYVDTRLDRTLQVNMGEPFFQRGNFPGVVQNGSEAIILENPWANGTIAAPFDQCEFFFSFPSSSKPSRCLRFGFSFPLPIM